MRFLNRLRAARVPATTAEADRRALRQLERGGADLAKPRQIIHVLYFRDDTDARHAATEIERAGYATKLEPPRETAGDWSVCAEARRVITASTIEAFRARFEQIATEFQGEYDGWEAASKP